MRTVSLHETDIILDRKKLDKILDTKGMTNKDLYFKVVDKFGLDLTYKGFMSLINNKSSWRLLYAYAIVKSLDKDFDDIYTIIKVDLDKKIEEKREWRQKYEKQK